MIAFASSLDTAGPIAQFGGRLRAAAERDGRFRPARLDQLDRPEEDCAAICAKPLKGLRIGLPKEFFGAGPEPRRRQAAIDAALAELPQKLGARSVDVSAAQCGKLAVPSTT
jgi:aspartyl-tRNA(Asn)/glutamyl-tRNA(Gln) amidotransferase subunit A